MKKKNLLVLLGLTAAVTLSGCGQSNNTKETQAPTKAAVESESPESEAAVTEAAQTESVETETETVEAQSEAGEAQTESAETETEAVETQSEATEAESEAGEPESEASETEFETEEESGEVFDETLDPITPSDYLTPDVSEYVTLGELTGIPVTQYTYTVTDDMVQEEIANQLSYYSEETSVERPAQEGDLVYADVVSTVQGDADSEESESTYFTIGDEEYGADFDAQILGASAGDTLEFSVSYTDDTWNADWEDQTVDFQVTVTDLCEQVIPELTEDFVKEYTDSATIEEYNDSIRQQLEDEYSESSRAEALDTLFEEAAALCEFKGYPQELYDSCQEEILSFYQMFTGTDDPQDVFDIFNITEEDLDADVMDEVNKRLLISALCTENDLMVTEEEYTDYVTLMTMSYGYTSAAQFEEDNSRETLVWSMFETLAGSYLYENAEITTEEYDLSSDAMDEDFEVELDDSEYEEIDTEDFETEEADTEAPEEAATENTDAADGADTETEA